MTKLGLAALSATLILSSSAGLAAPSEQGEERRAVFIEPDFCAIFLAPSPVDGGFFLAFGDETHFVHTSGGATNIQCRAQTLAPFMNPPQTLKIKAMCGYFDDMGDEDPSNDRLWEGESRVTINPDGSTISKCNLNRNDEVPFVEFPG